MLGFVSEPQLASFHSLALGLPTYYYESKATVPGDALPPTGERLHLVHILERLSSEPAMKKMKKKKKDFSRTELWLRYGKRDPQKLRRMY